MRNPRRTPFRALVPVLLAAACAPPSGDGSDAPPPPDPAAERAAAEEVLEALHRLASEGDFDAYFQLFTPDAVFMGTDATERWSVDDFRGYAAGSSGWSYRMTERHVFVDADASTAWFDERLENANYGETRGTGVLRKTPQGWKIVQYNLTIPIPNPLAREFAGRIREHLEG